ncbi:MAG: acyl carrier protein [Erysipelotrichales bacterium]|nr:acyl carrier protein [Erysipelotrichales bacterium]
MEIQGFIEKFTEIFEDTDTLNFSSDTNFRDNDEWSSLSVMMLIAIIDENYGVKIKGEDIQKAKTIHDIYDLVNKNKNV